MVNDYGSDAAQPRRSTGRVALGSRRRKEDGAAAPSISGSAVRRTAGMPTPHREHFPRANEVEFLDLGEYQNAEIHCTPFLPANEALTWASLVDSIAACTTLMFTSGDALTSTSRSAPATFRAESAVVRSAGKTDVLSSRNSPFARICRAA